MNHFKRLAIIGSSGMVGSDLSHYLKSYFQHTTCIDRKNYNRYRGQHFDVVINANGNSNKVWAKENVLGDFEESTVSVYKSLYDFSCNLYIYISSADVYEDHSSARTTDESVTIHPKNLSSYGLHKYLSECIIRNAAKNYLIFRCPMILGTHLKKGPIYDILHNIRLFVSEKSAYQMITTNELARIICFLLDKNISQDIFNIGGRGTVSLKNVHTYMQKQIIFPKNGETHVYETAVSKLNALYPLKTSHEYLQDLLKAIK